MTGRGPAKLTKHAADALSVSFGDTVLSGRGLKMKAERLSVPACEGLWKAGRLPAVAFEAGSPVLQDGSSQEWQWLFALRRYGCTHPKAWFMDHLDGSNAMMSFLGRPLNKSGNGGLHSSA